MNKNRWAHYRKAFAHWPFTTWYLAALLLVVLASWIAGVYGSRISAAMEETVVHNLLSAESVRWEVRNVLDNFAKAPIVPALMVLFILSIVKVSGSGTAFCQWVAGRHRTTLSRKQQHAVLLSLVVLLLCVSLVVWGVLTTGSNLLSVTGRLQRSPLQHGWLFLLLFITGIPSLFFGWMSGEFRSECQVLHAFTLEISRTAPFFFTLFVASQLVALLRYSGFLPLLHCSESLFNILSQCLYWLPLVLQYFHKEQLMDVN